jgi:hypothetical protein
MSDEADPQRRTVLWLYIATLTLLATHQVDGAYWEEWDTFRLPIGIEGFLAFNVIVLPPFLYGLVEVARWTRRAVNWSYAVAALGIFTFLLHAVILALGNDDFRSTPSITLFVAILASSVAQALATRRATA